MNNIQSQSMMRTHQLLKARDAAKLLGISERTLWTITKQGKLPCAKIEKSVRYRSEDLMRYVESCLTVQPSG